MASFLSTNYPPRLTTGNKNWVREVRPQGICCLLCWVFNFVFSSEKRKYEKLMLFMVTEVTSGVFASRIWKMHDFLCPTRPLSESSHFFFINFGVFSSILEHHIMAFFIKCCFFSRKRELKSSNVVFGIKKNHV